MNFRYDSDMASDIKDEKDFEATYDYYEEKSEHYYLEVIKLLKDDKPYNKKKGTYISIEFENIDNQESYESVRNKLCEILNQMTTKIKPIKKVLICGLGNSDLACDRLGPLLKNRIEIKEIGTTFLLIPGVKGQTGIETYDLISSYNKQCQPDLMIIVDALATRSIQRMNHVIQLTDAGLRPGSGIGNDCLELSQESLNVPVISLGVPTVVRLINIAIDLLRYLEIEDTSEFEKEIKNSHFNQVVMDKGCDLQVEHLASLISEAINLFLNENKV